MFQGREYIRELGIYDYRHRVYDPGLGRFLQRDPIGFDGGDANLFRYCGDDPVNWMDDSGLRSIPARPGGQGGRGPQDFRRYPRAPMPHAQRAAHVVNRQFIFDAILRFLGLKRDPPQGTLDPRPAAPRERPEIRATWEEAGKRPISFNWQTGGQFQGGPSAA
jgi:RHS repeat-associated protein